MSPGDPLTVREFDCVRLRYFEGLTSREIAERLGLTLDQVRYRFTKPNVRRYILTHALPFLIKTELNDIEWKMDNPALCYFRDLWAQRHADRYIWCGNKKHWYPDNRKRGKALDRLCSFFGVYPGGRPRNFNRDLTRWVDRWVTDLAKRRERILKAYYEEKTHPKYYL